MSQLLPEIYAIIACYVGEGKEGDYCRERAGNVSIKHEDIRPRGVYTYKNGLLHSWDDIPAVTNRNKFVWYKDGKIHRENDLPAIITGIMLLETILSGESYEWYIEGKRHRYIQKEDLPAIIFADGSREWWINGILQKFDDK